MTQMRDGRLLVFCNFRMVMVTGFLSDVLHILSIKVLRAERRHYAV